MIDFLNLNRVDKTGANPYDYYVHGPVEGRHAIIDNQGLKMDVLFGYYSDWSKGEKDNWVHIDLKSFIKDGHGR